MLDWTFRIRTVAKLSPYLCRDSDGERAAGLYRYATNVVVHILYIERRCHGLSI